MSSDRPASNSSSRPKQLRRRPSTEMYDRLKRYALAGDISQTTIDNQHYVKINNVNYRILDGNVTDFNNENQPIVQIGVHGPQELVILDPSSPFLKGIYKELNKLINEELGPNPDTQSVLDYAMAFVRKILSAHLSDNLDVVKKIVSQAREMPENPMYHGTPVLSIASFIRKKSGVCRHHGLLMAYLMQNLINDKLLPAGTVFYHRDKLEDRGRHAWAMYKPVQAAADNKQVEYDFYLIDSMWNAEAINVMKARLSDDPRLENYGVEIINECLIRYNKSDLESVPYTALKDNKIKEDFIDALLEAKPDECLKFLNYQYSLKACEEIRRVIYTALPSAKNQKYEKYLDLLESIKTVLHTPFLHKLNYNKIFDEQDKQQYVLALLLQSHNERSLILNQQDEDSLKLLRNLLDPLQAVYPDRKDFQQYAGYLNIVKDINNRLEAKTFLYSEKYQNLPKTLREQFRAELMSCDLNERNLVLAKQDISDLHELKKSLIRPGRFDEDQVKIVIEIIKEIDRIVALELINLIDTIVLSEQSKVNSGWTPVLWAPQKETKDIPITSCGKSIHEKIKEINLADADIRTLTRLINSISDIATVPANNSTRNTDSETTQKFLAILQNNNNKEPSELLAELTKFQNATKELSSDTVPTTKFRFQ